MKLCYCSNLTSAANAIQEQRVKQEPIAALVDGSGESYSRGKTDQHCALCEAFYLPRKDELEIYKRCHRS